MPRPESLPDLPRFRFEEPGYKRDPYAIYRRLRERTPVMAMDRMFVGDAVVVVRYDDVQRVLRDDAGFSNDVRVTPDYRPPPWWVPGIVRSFQDDMVGLDGPADDRVRWRRSNAIRGLEELPLHLR